MLPDDLVSVFYKQSCQFGFATHLFGSELKVLFSQETAPRGIRFRISPTSHSDLLVLIRLFIIILLFTYKCTRACVVHRVRFHWIVCY